MSKTQENLNKFLKSEDQQKYLEGLSNEQRSTLLSSLMTRLVAMKETHDNLFATELVTNQKPDKTMVGNLEKQIKSLEDAATLLNPANPSKDRELEKKEEERVNKAFAASILSLPESTRKETFDSLTKENQTKVITGLETLVQQELQQFQNPKSNTKNQNAQQSKIEDIIRTIGNLKQTSGPNLSASNDTPKKRGP